MQIPEKDKPMMFVSLGVLLFGFLAVVTWILGSQLLFYICVVLALALGFYLTYNLSKERPQEQASAGRKR